MKKAGLLLVTLVFVLGLGTAYAAGNGITDFSGRSYDRFEIGTAPGNPVADRAYESSAPGNKRLIEDFNTTGQSHDTFEIGGPGPSKHGMKQNWGTKESSVRANDTFEIELAK